jgi:hypothetical protein
MLLEIYHQIKILNLMVPLLSYHGSCVHFFIFVYDYDHTKEDAHLGLHGLDCLRIRKLKV